MIKNSNIKILFFFFITLFVTGQNANRTFEGIKQNENYLEIYTNDGTYNIKPYTDKIIETSFIPKGETFNVISHAIVLSPQNTTYKVKESFSKIIYSTPGIVVIIEKSPFKISYTYKNKILISEKKGYYKTDTIEALEFNLKPQEVLYGTGERVLGMNRRGNKLRLYNQAHYGYETYSELMNYTMPLVLSSNKYAIHFDNAPIGYLDLDSQENNTLTYETIGSRKTYQILVGDSWNDLIDHYTNLTGKQPLIPLWALGNFSSRFGYHSEKETRATVAKFSEDNIPLDAVVIDLYWFGKEIKGSMGTLKFDADNFPEPKKMMEDFRKKGIKTILVTEPFILTTSDRWQEAVDKKILATDSLGNPFTYDFFFGNTGLIDVFKPKARNWFWNIYKDLIHDGVSGWWGDLGEPEVHPSALRHKSGTADELHNIYGHHWAKLVFEGYQKEFPNQRPFILMRSGYSGSQRYGLIPWSGDVNRTWGGLQSQMEISLQMGMQGLAYMHSDLGGFAGNLLDNELYTRWLQYGIFQPIFRPHAQEDVASEPIYKDDKTKTLAKKAIILRYSLLPYNYTLAFENNQKGSPLMRPLFFEEPQNKKLLTVDDTYLWGNAFLVTPIVKAGVTEQDIYFPKQTNWYDFYTDKKYTAGSTKNIKIVLDHIPVFVKAGSFIPMIPPIKTTDNYSIKNLIVHYYHDKNIKESTGMLYNDNGITPNTFEKGMYEIIHFKSESKKKELTFTIHSEKGESFSPENKNLLFMIHQVTLSPKNVSIEKETIRFEWDKEKAILKIPLAIDTHTSETKIQIQLSK